MTIAIIMLFGACSNDILFNENDNGLSSGKKGTISITASMPDENPTTRVSLEQDEDLAISLKWEVGDLLQLVFVQGETKVKSTVAVKDISSDGRNAKFDIIIPEQITGKFDLYGVYGGGGLSDENPTLAIMPANTGDAGSLTSVEERKDVMFYFASKDMEITVTQASVIFKNFGSLFSITFKNTSAANIDGLTEARLVGVGGDSKWAYNTGAGGNTFDLITGKFQDTENAGNHISFNLKDNSLEGGKSITFWTWNAPLVDKVWPELKLELRNATDVVVTSANTLPARTEATVAGMTYYLNAEWDGSKLNFKTSVKEPLIFVKATGTDANDGSSWATATTLSKALEIMNPGDEIHIAAGTYMPTKMLTGGDKEGDKTFEINKNVTLIGGYPANASDGAVASKANKTILSGNKKSYHTLTVTAPVEAGKKVTIKNLEIKHGVAGPVGEGNVEVNGVKFNRSFGGGLSVGKSIIDVLDCVISDNESKQHVGGVYVHSGAVAKFIDTDIVGNKAIASSTTNCGGILNAATTYLIDCNVLDNEAGGVCGGIYNFDKENGGAIGPKLYIYNTTVAGNKAGSSWSGGGGLYAREGSHSEIVNSTFYNNEAQHGGAIRVYTASGLNPSSANIISSTFYKNNGRGNGGAIETQPGTTVKMYNTIVTGNTSPNGADVLLAENTTKSSYVVLGNKVLDKDGSEVVGKTFDHTTMISEMPVNGTYMITNTSPAATLGMDANLLQSLGSTFTPPIENGIITNDQLGNSRTDKFIMGAVVETISGGGDPGTEPKIYVKTTGVEANDGSSWAKATTLSKALELMKDGDEVHIAAGTYVPTKMVTGGTEEGDKTFEINKNVTLIGGYPANATDGAVANKANKTILSGNKKSFHTVTITAPIVNGKKVILKNLIIKEGLSNGAGSVSINGVNYPRGYAGGISIAKCVIDVIDCVISDNEATGAAGGVYVQYDAFATFRNSDIVNNITGGTGGGIMNASTTYLIGCNISDNTSATNAGGISNSNPYGRANVYLYNSTVARNKTGTVSWNGGGGIYAQAMSYTQIVNTTFSENSVGSGGAIRTHGTEGKEAHVDLINSTIYNNTALENGGAIQIVEKSTVSIYNSIITGNKSKGADISGTATSSYVVLGDKVLDKVGNEVAGKTFDHTTMISKLSANGACMIKGSSPAATLGMSAILLQDLAIRFDPAIDNNIISKDQLGKSREGKYVMGSVVPEGIVDGSGDVPGMDPEFP